MSGNDLRSKVAKKKLKAALKKTDKLPDKWFGKKKASKKELPKLPKNTDPNVLEETWKEITYNCPTRGLVTEKIKVKILKPQGSPDMSVMPDSNPATGLDEQDNGLHIYSEEELEKSSDD